MEALLQAICRREGALSGQDQAVWREQGETECRRWLDEKRCVPRREATIPRPLSGAAISVRCHCPTCSDLPGAAFAIDPRPWTERQEGFRKLGGSLLLHGALSFQQYVYSFPLQSPFRHSPLMFETKQRLSVSRSCRQSIRRAD